MVHRVRATSHWRSHQPLAWLFVVTIVLPACALAAFAWRSADAERRLSEQGWRERIDIAARRAFGQIERHTVQAREYAEALARGEFPAGPPDVASFVVGAGEKPRPSALFAWIADGVSSATPPPDLDAAETHELRAASPLDTVDEYRRLIRTTPPEWQGWVYLRIARILRKAGRLEESQAALEHAARLPDAPISPPTRFAARFELASQSADAARGLYAELERGDWLLEKSMYAYYEPQLREMARLPVKTQVRESMSRLLERAIAGESGWLSDGDIHVAALRVTKARTAIVLLPEPLWRDWLRETAAETGVTVHMGPRAPEGSLSIASFGPPWAIWAEQSDPAAATAENENRRKFFLAALSLAAGVLLFGTFTALRLVRRELTVARQQADFTAAVSHEFRSPLTGIRQLGEMLLAGRAANDENKRRQYYEMIVSESDRLTRLVENVLDFARIEEGRKQFRADRIETAPWLVEMAATAGRRRVIDCLVPDSLPAVEGDRDALSSAVLNLLDNAFKYSPAETPVTLRASVIDGKVTIAVEDKGCGIAAEDRDRIFERFYRGTKTSGGPGQGVGLGLALVKRIADAHGARLSVESEPGKGSVFSLTLKAAA